jgi:BMFP domain-containing protein YqiC
LIEAVKAQQAQLAAERSAIDDLNARVAALEAALQP